MRRALLAYGSALTTMTTLGPAGPAAAAPAEEPADLGVSVTASTPKARPGDLVDHTVTVANSGPGTAPATARVQLPRGLAVVSVDSGHCVERRRAVECSLPAMEPGTARFVHILGIVKPGAAGTLRTTASVRSNRPDPAPANDTAALAVPVEPGTDLRVRLKGPRRAPRSAARAARVPITAVVVNRGPRPVTGVTLNLGAHGASLRTAPGDHCTQTRRSRVSQYLTCALGALKPGERRRVQAYVYRVTASRTQEYAAAVTSDLGDTQPSNNTATFTTALLTRR